jgi:O-antigen ligase
VVILVLAMAVFALAKAPITAQACSAQDFERRRNLWFVLTLSAFLAHNFWLFVLVASCALAFAIRTESNRFALYLSLMLALPRLSASIPGLGIVNELFEVNQLRLLALVVLLPTYLKLRKQPGVEPFGQLLCDKLLVCIFALNIALELPHGTLTSTLRNGVLYAFTDVFLTYYVASRSLRTLKAFRDALGAFVVGAMVFCVILAFEFGRHWLLYRAVDTALGANQGVANYLLRAGLLRAEGTAGQSIIAGYTCAVAIGLYLYVRTLVPNAAWRILGLLVLIAGAIGAMARAPWLGAVIMIALFIVLGPTPFASFAKLAIAGLVSLPILLMTDAGATIVDFLPWVGTVDENSVAGRERLATAALQVIAQNPFFGLGHFDSASIAPLEELRDGAGIIDLVNTYIIIALRGGVVSLALFVGLIVVAILGICTALHKVRDKQDERHVLGRSLLATLLGVLFVIGTTSPIFSVYSIYWALAGLAVGYRLLIARGDGAQGPAAAEVERGLRGPTARWAAATHKRTLSSAFAAP